VDTGSEISVIKKETAKDLGIKTFSELGLEPSLVELESGIIGVKRIGEKAPVVVEINGCRTDAFIIVADVRDEVIGADFLQQVDAIVDMKKRKVIPRKCEPYKV